MTTAASDIVLARLTRLHPKLIDLSLGRIEGLLAALGNPQDRLPPVIHVAGTNGKGSTVATLRACLEAGGWRVHAYTSPHLVRFHERIRLAGELIGEDRLILLLEECEGANRGAPITYFEITTAAALLAFARVPADFVLLETGLGGRLDATNVVKIRRRPRSPRSRSTTRPFSANDRRHRRREGRHPESGRAGGHRPADARGRRRLRRPRRRNRRPALSLRPGVAVHGR